jgi:Tfp pilus assembly protein PilN
MTPRRLELDYVAAPRRSPWLGVAVLAVALATAGHLGLRHQTLRHDIAAATLANGMRDADSLPLRTVSKEKLDEEIKTVEAAVRQLTLPWTDIVQAVEASAMREVGILNMQPDPQQRVLRLTAEAKTREAMVEYVRRMSQTKIFSEVYLVNHHVQTEDPSRPIQFAVQASFQGAK